MTVVLGMAWGNGNCCRRFVLVFLPLRRRHEQQPLTTAQKTEWTSADPASGAMASSSTSSSANTTAPATIEHGHWVLLSLSDGECRLVCVRRGSTTKVGRQFVPVDPLIGSPFGANFLVEPKRLVRDPRTVEEISGSIGDAVCAQPGASNAELNDNPVDDEGHAQSLGEQDIKRLKAQGTHGADLVRAIAAGSATFAGKTAFAQEKYLRKKAKKHMPFLTATRPTPLTICDMYMTKSPDKLLWLRRDSLALLLTSSNVQPGARVLVVESTNGLLAGAAAQRLGGDGRVLSVSVNGKPAIDAVQYLNLPTDAIATLKTCSLQELLSCPELQPPERRRELDASLDQTVAAASVTPPQAPVASGVAMDIESGAAAAHSMDVDGAETLGAGLAGAAISRALAAAAGKTAEGAAAASARKVAVLRGGALIEEVRVPTHPCTRPLPHTPTHARAHSRTRPLTTNRQLAAPLGSQAATGFTSLLVATREPPAPALLPLLSRLQPGSPFALYHPSLQPLAECMYTAQQVRTSSAAARAVPPHVLLDATRAAENAAACAAALATAHCHAPPQCGCVCPGAGACFRAHAAAGDVVPKVPGRREPHAPGDECLPTHRLRALGRDGRATHYHPRVAK